MCDAWVKQTAKVNIARVEVRPREKYVGVYLFGAALRLPERVHAVWCAEVDAIFLVVISVIIVDSNFRRIEFEQPNGASR